MTRERSIRLDRIVVDPKIMVGKPTVRGTRIPVELVVEQLSYDRDPRELFAAYPRLAEEDVKACIAFAQHVVKGKKVRAREEKESAGAHGGAA